jgi:NAD(P)-dependent dehydrogenase (short-subunit alcohol dehydrogenase family)
MDMTEQPDRSFAGKVALVTGGSRGMGALASRFAFSSELE